MEDDHIRRYESSLLQQCIFCDGKPVTEEDFWPKWLQRQPGIQLAHRHTVSRIGDTFDRYRGLLDRQSGGIRKIKCACAECNNGWMSRLQNRTKRIVLDRWEGLWPPLDLYAQETLVRWIAMTCMVYEFADPTTAAVSKSDRSSFRTNGSVSPNMMIWIGILRESDTPPDLSFLHTGIALNLLPPRTYGFGNMNIHVSTFSLKRLVFHVLYDRGPVHAVSLIPDYGRNFGFVQLHPITGDPVVDRPNEVGTADVVGLTTALRKLARILIAQG